ncbi:MAG TPA: hypothetical protein VJW20_11230 [Candidatus Angelobacter sp.]|nr:hypothetical protein [Candidatus Angelobacter sp.]
MKTQPVLEVRFALRFYTPKALRRAWIFTQSVANYWGSLVTGGITIGLLGVWQQTGHHVWTFSYWVVAVIAFFVACFKAWNVKAEQVEAYGFSTKESELLVQPFPKH